MAGTRMQISADGGRVTTRVTANTATDMSALLGLGG